MRAARVSIAFAIATLVSAARMSPSTLSKLCAAIGLIAAVACFDAKGGFGAELLVSPTGEQACLLYYRIANAPPPLDRFAANKRLRRATSQ